MNVSSTTTSPAPVTESPDAHPIFFSDRGLLIRFASDPMDVSGCVPTMFACVDGVLTCVHHLLETGGEHQKGEAVSAIASARLLLQMAMAAREAGEGA